MTLTGVIPIGQSRRMGRAKALLPFGSQTIIEIVAARLREVCDDVLLVTNATDPYRHLGLRMVPDALPWGDSLVGIYTGLLHAPGPVFVSACDMPFLNPALVRYLVSLASGVDVVIPRRGGAYKPLHALYAPACLDPMLRCLWRYAPLTDFLYDVRVRIVDDEEMRRVDPDLRSVIDVDTPEEYAWALEHVSRDARAGPGT